LRTFKVEANGRSYVVKVEQIGNRRLSITIDNDVFETEEIGQIGNADFMTWIMRPAEEVFHVQSKSVTNDNVEVWISSTPFSVTLRELGSLAHLVSLEAESQKGFAGEIRALMPGRVTNMLVREGDQVEIGTPLLIFEAMKMQNEISSPIVGRVKSVHVQEGTTVKKDSLLVKIT